jgi:hypothetical protein
MIGIWTKDRPGITCRQEIHAAAQMAQMDVSDWAALLLKYHIDLISADG